ncbi:MAG: ribonuclease PH, partial [Polyangiaceae bacterium]
AKIKAPVIREAVAATSAGILPSGEVALDLMYLEDSKAEVDLNVVATASGKIVEVQGTAEGEPVERKQIDRLVDSALAGIKTLGELQKKTLAQAGVDLASLLYS